MGEPQNASLDPFYIAPTQNLNMLTHLARTRLQAAPPASALPASLGRAAFSSTARVRSLASTQGGLPPYGPVGVTRALEASSSARTSQSPRLPVWAP